MTLDLIAAHWALVVAIIAAGVGGGLLAGLLGVGGGIIIVPVLFVAFTALGYDDSISMKVAVASPCPAQLATGLRV